MSKLPMIVCLAACGRAAIDDPPLVGDAPPSSSDAATGALCGNGSVDPGELCDGDGRACTDLGATFTGGSASCRADCRGWDPSACTLANPGRYEAVKPAARDPRFAAARCNDGTPFSFVVRLASPRTDRWVIYLEGGVYCDDRSFACAGRDPTLVTTLPFPDRAMGPIPITGLLG